MELRGPVLAATALDASGDEVIRQAGALSNVARVSLVVCHVVPEIYAIRPPLPQLAESERAYAEAARSGVVAAAEKQLSRGLEGNTTARELRIEAGSPHSVVLQVADEVGAGLVVVGGGSVERGAPLGGVAERIVRHAQCPVLIARPASGRTVLAATDFSDPALPAIEAGNAEARRRGQRFVVMHSVEVRMLPVESPEASSALVLGHLLEAETERANAALRRIASDCGPETQSLLRAGPPADVIVDAAAEIPADLIVVGTHGRSGLRRLTLGSVAESVMRRAHCSVLVVRLAT